MNERVETVEEVWAEVGVALGRWSLVTVAVVAHFCAPQRYLFVHVHVHCVHVASLNKIMIHRERERESAKM